MASTKRPRRLTWPRPLFRTLRGHAVTVSGLTIQSSDT